MYSNVKEVKSKQLNLYSALYINCSEYGLMIQCNMQVFNVQSKADKQPAYSTT